MLRKDRLDQMEDSEDEETSVSAGHCKAALKSRKRIILFDSES